MAVQGSLKFSLQEPMKRALARIESELTCRVMLDLIHVRKLHEYGFNRAIVSNPTLFPLPTRYTRPATGSMRVKPRNRVSKVGPPAIPPPPGTITFAGFRGLPAGRVGA
jgi:hypothetical protein